MKYIINEDMYFLIRKEKRIEIVTKEQNYVFIGCFDTFINESCKYYGSSYEGRKNGSRYLLSLTSKLPIILNEKKNLVLFPINSDRSKNNIWFMYNNILNYKKVKNYVEVTFKNKEKMIFLISYYVFRNQMLKSSQLLTTLLLRE